MTGIIGQPRPDLPTACSMVSFWQIGPAGKVPGN